MRPAGMTPALAAGDLVRIAMLEGTSAPSGGWPTKILADGTVDQLTRAESASVMTNLALIARGFALALPEQTRVALLLELEAILSDAVLAQMEYAEAAGTAEEAG